MAETPRDPSAPPRGAAAAAPHGAIFMEGAAALAEAMARGELSSEQIVSALQARAREVEPELNALAIELGERALEEARRADLERARGRARGPLHGLPITIKENVDLRGMPSTLGLRHRARDRAAEDALVVALARRAGAVILAKTNVPQTLLSPLESVNALYGTTRNPWRTGHGSGGSSGGEAAALASGTSVLGVGTDIGGSIRVPAAFCGVCGLKPTAHRWSNLGSSTAIAGQETIRSQIGPMARSVADLRLLWESLSPLEMAKRDPLVPPIAASGPEPGLPAGLRVGFYVDDGFLTPAASVQRGVREAVAALEAAGIEAIPYRPSNAEELTYLYFQVLSSDGGATLERILAGEPMIPSLQQLRRIARLPAIARRALAELMERRGERRVAELLRSLGRKGVERLWELTARRSEMLREEMAAWDAAGIDALVTPPFATTAAPLGAAHDFTIGFCYAARFNVLNLPAGVVPISTVRPSEIARPLRGDRLDRRVAAIEGQSLGLPLSAQIVTRPYQEELALALMGAVEAQLRATGAQPQTPIDPR